MMPMPIQVNTLLGSPRAVFPVEDRDEEKEQAGQPEPEDAHAVAGADSMSA